MTGTVRGAQIPQNPMCSESVARRSFRRVMNHFSNLLNNHFSDKSFTWSRDTTDNYGAGTTQQLDFGDCTVNNALGSQYLSFNDTDNEFTVLRDFTGMFYWNVNVELNSGGSLDIFDFDLVMASATVYTDQKGNIAAGAHSHAYNGQLVIERTMSKGQTMYFQVRENLANDSWNALAKQLTVRVYE